MNPPPYLWVYMLVLCISIAMMVSWGVGTALQRAGKAADEIARAVRFCGTLLFGWLAFAALLGWLGVFKASVDRNIPFIAFAIVIPVVCGIWTMQPGSGLAGIIRATPQSWLVGIQCYRGAGAIFLILYGLHFLPAVFALPAGFGDVLVGLLALPAAAIHASGSKHRNAVVVAWNLLGILDLVLAIALGFLSAPTPFEVLALDAPNVLISVAPAVLIPTFAVPLSIVLHIASLKKLAWDAGGGRPGGALAPATP